MNPFNKHTELHEKFPRKNNSIYFSLKDVLAPPTIPLYPLHWHTYIEILYVIEGNYIAQYGNDIINVTEDSFLIVNGNELHQSIGGMRRYAFLLVNPAFFNKPEIILKRLVRDPCLSELMHKMIDERRKNDEFSELNIRGYAYLLITYLYRNYAYKIIDKRDYEQYSQKKINLNECIKYIHDNYNKDISPEYIADMANVSQYHFCNIFKEFTGQTFKEYHNRIRIHKAIELLGATDMSVTEIAISCGFNDSNYFTRKFRQITGKTPVAAREDIKEMGTSNLEVLYL